MKKHLFRTIISSLLIVCFAFNIGPSLTFAEETKTVSDLDALIAGIATVEDIYGGLDSNTVPEIIGYDYAVSKTHVQRLYAEEGDDLNRIVFLNADGSQTAYIFDYPVKYIDKTGLIKDVTLEIEDSDIFGEFKSASSSSVTTFSRKLSDGIGLAGNGTTVSLVPHIPTTNSSTFSTDTSKVTADSIAKRIDNKTISYDYDSKTAIEYSLTYTGFKEDIVVKEYTGQTEYEFTLYTNGLRLTEIDDFFFLVDGNNTIKATLGDIIIFTADEKNNTTGELHAQTVIENQEYLLTISVDSEFLISAETVYPIRIDPTVEICYDNNGAGAISDVTLNSNEGSSGTSGSLFVGLRETYGISRVLMKFPGLELDSLGDNIKITNATVELRDLLCEGTALNISCYIFAGNVWNESTADWSNVNPNSISSLLSSNVVSYNNGVQQTTSHRYAFDITNAVEGWRTGTCNQNKGIIFKCSSAVEDGGKYNSKTFASYNRASDKPSLSITYSTADNLISDDTYYLNNRYCGDYLRYTSSAATASSGLISSLGNSIRWEIRAVDGGYVIRSKTNTTKYLGVSENSNTSTAEVSPIEIVTVVDESIPKRCVWNIRVANGGGCLVKNTYNSRYLYSYGDTVYTVQGTGAVGTTTYDTRVWRIASTTYYGNTSSTSYREMASTTCFNTHNTHISEQKLPTVRKTYSNEIWVTTKDFSYIVYAPQIIKLDPMTGKITGCKRGTTTVCATHKVTDRTSVFTVVVEETFLYKTERQPGLDENGQIARDMHCSDKSKSDLLSMNLNLGNLAIIYDTPPSSSTLLPLQGPEVLMKYIRELPEVFAWDDVQMKDVASEMIEHFLSGNGTPYSDYVLTNRVLNHQKTISFIDDIEDTIISRITIQDNDLYSISKTSAFIAQMDEISESSPAYNLTSDYANGLKLCLNGIWGLNVEITEFSISGSNYSVTIEYTLFDHFGLDDGDVTESGWYSEFLGYTQQFGSWYVLQRYQNCNNQYKPFVTYVTFSEVYNGTLS